MELGVDEHNLHMAKTIDGDDAYRNQIHSRLVDRCNKKCRQSRQRKCIPSVDTEAHKRCAQQHVLKQERTCRKGRCKRGGRAFHVVLPPKRESLKQPTTTSSSSSQNQQQSDVRVLLSLNSIFYSSWSRWSACTKACTTTRYR